MATLSNLVVMLALDSKKFKDGIESAAKTSKNASSKITSGLEGINKMYGVLAGSAAIVAVKKAFDMAKEGQTLIQVEKRYSALVDTIGGSRSTLEGLVAITGRQVDNFSAMASASSLMELGLANSEDELQKHFEIVSRLKKPHEDFSQALENWSLLLANKSIPRLDSFGISGSEVRERWRELTATIGDSDRAFQLAVFEQAEKSMARLGDEVPIDEFAVWDTSVKNLTDNLKVMAAEGLGPVVAGVNDFIETVSKSDDVIAEKGEVIRDRIHDYESAEVAIQHLGKAYDLARSPLGMFTGAKDDLAQQMTEAFRALTAEVEGYEQFRQIVQDAGYDARQFERITGENIHAFYRENEAIAKTTRTLKDHLATGQQVADGYRRLYGEGNKFSASLEDQIIAGQQMANAYDRQYTPAVNKARAAGERMVKEQEEQKAAMEALAKATSEYMQETNRYIDELDAMEESAEGLTVTNDELAESFFETARQMAESAEAQREFGLTGEEATLKILGLGVAIGELTQEQADAIIRQIELQAAIDEVSAAFLRGEISVYQARDALLAFSQGEYDTAAAAIEATKQVQNLIDRINELPDSKRIELIVEQRNLPVMGNPLPVPGAAGQYPVTGPSSGAVGGGYVQPFDDASFRVPPGGPPMMAAFSAGDYVMASKEKPGGGSGYNIIFEGPVYGEDALVKRLDEYFNKKGMRADSIARRSK